MTSAEPASSYRVFALRNADDQKAFSYGFGTYVGDQPCPVINGYLNPKIVLDNGAGVVWGCECWWGPEEAWEGYAGTREIVPVPAPHTLEEDAAYQRETRRPLSELGHWENMVFVFSEPYTMPGGNRVLRVDFSQAVIPEGVTLQEVLEAMTDPAAITTPAEEDPELGGQYSQIVLPPAPRGQG